MDTVKAGDKIVYAQEDHGRDIAWQDSDEIGRLASELREEMPEASIEVRIDRVVKDNPHLLPGRHGAWRFVGDFSHLDNHPAVDPEIVTVGAEIPVWFCQRLVDDGICKVVVDDAASTDKPKRPRPVKPDAPTLPPPPPSAPIEETVIS